MTNIDVLLIQQSTGIYDVEIEDGDLKATGGFDSVIYVALMTDARADSSQVQLPQDRRGWVGNIVSPVADRQLGGLLWLVQQNRLNQITLNEAIDYAQKALRFMVLDGIALEVEVTGQIVIGTGIALTINIIAPDGRTSTHYVPLWEVTGV